MITIRTLDPQAIAAMVPVDLATLAEEPPSMIETFQFHGCTAGVSAFTGRPPWEWHGSGDELLLVLDGSSELTVLQGDERVVRTLAKGTLAVVPRARWHVNSAPTGVTLLWVTPAEGNRHTWDDPGASGVCPT